ncbi:MAG TPA: hypothetical protein VK188_13575 [Holophaga sp.]|nr:hypothetical protein [Holophaga sp.]
MTDSNPPSQPRTPEGRTPEGRTPAIPDQLIQIAHEQEGGAERVISQMEVVQNSFEEIQALARECQVILQRIYPPSDDLADLVDKMESIALHADNGTYNVQGVYDLFQYQDIVRQKLEKVGHRLIDVSEYILKNLQPMAQETLSSASSGRDILERRGQEPDQVKPEADAIIAEFFSKLRGGK